MWLDFFFPRRCLGCGQWGDYFCQTCSKTIKFVKGPICPVCQRPSFSGQTHSFCRTKFDLDGLVTIFAYQGLIRKAITKLKYKLVTDLAKELVDLALLKRRLPFKDSFFLVPVPLHSRRERERGFNQAEVLGRLLAKKYHWLIEPEALIRHRYTPPQVKLEGKKRKTNIKGAFKIQNELEVKSLNLVIFDDVWTTGSTLKECGRVLKRAGAKKVWGLTLAR